MRLTSLVPVILLAVACGSDAPAGENAGLSVGGGSGGEAGASAGANASACVPGKQETCGCPTGMGIQACREDGSGFGACACGEGAGQAGAGGGFAGSGGASAGGTSDGGASGSGLGGAPAGGSAGGPAGGESGQGPGNDADGDGWSTAEGDCDDGNPQVNPGAFDAPQNGVDDDCNGKIDDVVASCDAGLGPIVGDPHNAAKAIGLCTPTLEALPPLERRPGLVLATVSNISGALLVTPPKTGADTSLQLGVLPSFGAGTVPAEGSSLLALSTGIARAAGQPDYVGNRCQTSKKFAGSTSYPSGFPKAGPCGKGGNPNDGIALDVRLRAPTNARSFTFRSKVFSCEYPDFTCSSFSDVFAVLVTPSPLQAGDPMVDKSNSLANVAFESGAGGPNLLGVNATSFLTACTASSKPKLSAYTSCLGEAGLKGSGYDGHGATSWLETRVPVPTFAPGEDRLLSIRFAIWDSSDESLDSSVAIDRFEWSVDEAATAATAALP